MDILVHPAVEDGRGWRSLAACLEADPELFFTEHREHTPAAQRQIAAAKAVCAGCPVQSPCRDLALSGRIDFGVWGGLSEGERRALRRRAVAV